MYKINESTYSIKHACIAPRRNKDDAMLRGETGYVKTWPPCMISCHRWTEG